jgi:hypothetical protein
MHWTVHVVKSYDAARRRRDDLSPFEVAAVRKRPRPGTRDGYTTPVVREIPPPADIGTLDPNW